MKYLILLDILDSPLYRRRLGGPARKALIDVVVVVVVVGVVGPKTDVPNFVRFPSPNFRT